MNTNTQEPERKYHRLRFQLLHFAVGFLVGVLFPLIASTAEVLRIGGTLSYENIQTAYLNIPLALKIVGPFILGITGIVLARLSLSRMEAQRSYNLLLLENARELQTKNDELRELNKMLDGLVYTASHDLKTPVVNFMGLINMMRTLEGRPGSEKMMAQVIEKMDVSAHRFMATITDLLSISRLAADDSSPPENVSIREVAEEVVGDISHLAEDHTWEVSIETEEAPILLIRRSTLHSILQNLFTNAIKYSRPDVPPRIVLRSHLSEGMVLLSVQDNGLGIDLDKYGDKLFKMFTRLHDRAGEGNGVGLYIVQQSVQKLGGEIEVDSTPGAGSTFRISFPQSLIP